jgi:hypothetical protein
MSDLEEQLRSKLHGAQLPRAPESLSLKLAALPEHPPTAVRSGRGRWWILIAPVAALLALGGAVLFSGAPSVQTASLPPTESSTERVAASFPASVDGHPVMMVSEVLAARAAGGMKGATIALGGYWSDGSVGHSCAPPQGKVGDLEYRCVDGEFGITELDEPIIVIDRRGHVTRAIGPHLTPWISNDLAGMQALFSLPIINGQRYRPVPILVVGHFDDPRAADCGPEAIKLCEDRLVVDRIAIFDPASVPTPGVSPTPSPFPSPWPSGLFDAQACFGDVPLSFLGWTTTEELHMPYNREGHVWAAVTRDPVLLISDRWSTDSSGRKFRWWARRICISEENQDPSMEFAEVPGSTYKEYDDGTRIYATP